MTTTGTMLTTGTVAQIHCNDDDGHFKVHQVHQRASQA